jgi:hypothetical protein
MTDKEIIAAEIDAAWRDYAAEQPSSDDLDQVLARLQEPYWHSVEEIVEATSLTAFNAGGMHRLNLWDRILKIEEPTTMEKLLELWDNFRIPDPEESMYDETYYELLYAP